ncbi:WD40 repeat-like protein [Wolfiporia cocos MD-104 SS10]|uniref:WD40 repeat-like protein n=1 Tax=Wolfiporia cocos (strain MD-104) TaxID=742152 RepID=A0A2H3J7T1_WOLCO|nr:WD40 repeat-like protein [Wolfiporia cocos MD-104 SS10]
MHHSDSDDEGIDDAEFDRSSEGEDDVDVDEDILDALEGDLAAEAAAAEEATDDVLPSPEPLARAPSPAQIRKTKLLSDITWPRSYTVEAICAIPHPVPTHCLASSLCMSHLLTGSEDGYIRDYDVFAAVNGKIFLTAPQRHHCGVMEGLMKAGQIKFWWENPAFQDAGRPEDVSLSSVYSLAMQSDALWALSGAGSDQGHINLFTVRHDPGRLCHTMKGHRGPVSALALQHDEKGFFSGGWDGEAIQWDLNTGQQVRKYIAHSSQLTALAVRPLVSYYDGHHWSSPQQQENPNFTSKSHANAPQPTQTDGYNQGYFPPQQQPAPYPPQQPEDDLKSESSYDPLFDEPDAEGEADNGLLGRPFATPNMPPQQQMPLQPQPQNTGRSAVAPKNAPPVLEQSTYSAFSPDVIMTAFIDGQVILWDTRVHSPGTGVGRLWMSEKTPPWCVSACWSADGAQIYAGRRNGTIDIWDVRQTGRAASGTPKILKTLRNPISSGVVSCVVAFPDGRHLACASIDNIRLWNVAEAGEPDASGKIKSGVQFKIIPGHHGGFISQMLVDPAARFLVSASSNRGWHGESTRTVFVHEIKHIR